MRRDAKTRTKRVYDAPSPSDGTRVPVDRLWPRGLKKEEARIDRWMKDLAPSKGLRTWFGHDPARRDEFRERFFTELDARSDAVESILFLTGPLTLLYGSREEHFNNAVALKEYLVFRRRRPARNKAA